MKMSALGLETNRQNATLNLQHFKSNLAKTLNSNWLRKFDKGESSNLSTSSPAIDMTPDHKQRKKGKKKQQKQHSIQSTPSMPFKLSHDNYKNPRREQYSSTSDLITDNLLNEIDLDQDDDQDGDEFSKLESNNNNNNNNEPPCLVHKVFYNSCASFCNGYDDRPATGQFMAELAVNHSTVVSSRQTPVQTAVDDKVSNTSSTVSLFPYSSNNGGGSDHHSDSGLASLNSAQLFFSEVRELLIEGQTTPRVDGSKTSMCSLDSGPLLYEHLASKIDNLDLVK
jgi:hypothetical protein